MASVELAYAPDQRVVVRLAKGVQPLKLGTTHVHGKIRGVWFSPDKQGQVLHYVVSIDKLGGGTEQVAPDMLFETLEALCAKVVMEAQASIADHQKGIARAEEAMASAAPPESPAAETA